MKKEIWVMKSIVESNKAKVPVVRIDKSLNKFDNIILFPEKVKKAKKDFEKFGLPDLNKKAAKQEID